MQGKERDLSIALSLSDCLGPKTSILVRVAKLLRLSIYNVVQFYATIHLLMHYSFSVTCTQSKNDSHIGNALLSVIYVKFFSYL